VRRALVKILGPPLFLRWISFLIFEKLIMTSSSYLISKTRTNFPIHICDKRSQNMFFYRCIYICANYLFNNLILQIMIAQCQNSAPRVLGWNDVEEDGVWRYISMRKAQRLCSLISNMPFFVSRNMIFLVVNLIYFRCNARVYFLGESGFILGEVFDSLERLCFSLSRCNARALLLVLSKGHNCCRTWIRHPR
jgi:hypothetical protein